MTIEEEINNYINSLIDTKLCDMEILHHLILKTMPERKLWFFDGKDAENRTVSNPNIGYGKCYLKYANGTKREFYRIGLSANKMGISIYIFGLENNKYLSKTYGHKIGKAKLSGYCIKFKSLKDINLEIMEELFRDIMNKDK